MRARVKLIVREQAAYLLRHALALLARDAHPLDIEELTSDHSHNQIYPALTPVHTTPEENVPLPSLRRHVGSLLKPVGKLTAPRPCPV